MPFRNFWRVVSHEQCEYNDINMMCIPKTLNNTCIWSRNPVVNIYIKKRKTVCDSEVLCNIGYSSETHLDCKSREIPFAHDILFNRFKNVYRVARQLYFGALCKVLKRLDNWNMTWTDEISWDLSLRWVSDGYAILHSTPDSESGLYV